LAVQKLKMNNFAGFLLTLVAGASVGFSMWLLKWVRAWKWEKLLASLICDFRSESDARFGKGYMPGR
jgi:hypothetical protein